LAYPMPAKSDNPSGFEGRVTSGAGRGKWVVGGGEVDAEKRFGPGVPGDKEGDR
jgi:hypothetical protein